MTEQVLHVVVLNWNGEKVIRECLSSLMKVRDVHLEIIVVDNASDDGSTEIVRKEFPSATLVSNPRNLLFAEGNNIGIRQAMESGARRILFLNNDTEVEPFFAGRLLDALESDPGAGIAGPKILYFDDPQKIWYGGAGFYPVLGIPRHFGIRRMDGSFPEERCETEWVSGCAMLVKREVIEDVGGFDPSYEMYCEDVDFCLRARRAGWKCIYEPNARVWHKVSSSSGGGMTPFKLEHRIASTKTLFRRFKPFWWRMLLWPLHVAVLFAVSLALAAGRRADLAKAALRGAVSRMGC